LSTLTDLFSTRIGGNRKAVFIYKDSRCYRVVTVQEKLPVRDEVRVRTYEETALSGLLEAEGVTKENVYLILEPGGYYANRVSFPFTERQKIEGVIKYEVKDYLPLAESDYLTDFYQAGGDISAFSVYRETISRILEETGPYRENLKAVIPYDMAIYYGMTASLEEEDYLFFDAGPGGVFIQYVEDRSLRTGVWIPRSSSDDRFRSALTAQVLMISRVVRTPIALVNGREERMNEVVCGILDDRGLSYREPPKINMGPASSRLSAEDTGALVPLFGAVSCLNGPPQARVNLLREEFKPRMRGYVSVRDFIFAGILLFLLFAVSTAGLLLDMNFRKNQVLLLRERFESLNEKVFGRRVVPESEARQLLEDMRSKVGLAQERTDGRYSSLRLLEELSLFLPPDVVIEYTDIIIERDLIRFSGKARTFSDIDKIRKELGLSEYFSRVELANTGTTGSTEGFTVSFTFEIEITSEL